MEENEVTDDDPHIDKFDNKGMDWVGPITLRYSNEDILDVLLELLGVKITNSGILDDAFTPSMSQELKKEK